MRLQGFVLGVKTTSPGTDFDPKLELRGPTLAAHRVSLLGLHAGLLAQLSKRGDPGSRFVWRVPVDPTGCRQH